jgi:hypothetical protein
LGKRPHWNNTKTRTARLTANKAKLSTIINVSHFIAVTQGKNGEAAIGLRGRDGPADLGLLLHCKPDPEHRGRRAT